MAVYLRGSIWWCEFMWRGHRVRESTEQRSRSKAMTWETNRRMELMRRSTISPLRKAPLLKEVAEEFLEEREAAYKSGNMPRNTYRHYANGWKQ